MAAVWILLSQTLHPARLIESSREHGVRSVEIPFQISAEFVPSLLRRADEELERLSAGLAPEAPEFTDILHRSLVMKRLIARARLVAPRSVPVLLEGESGTGKELLARAIHRAGPRCGRSFVAVNCGALTASLVESELFGHARGAFTGASREHVGYFEQADGGTIFLDEIGELPLPAQVKLLRVLQEGEVTPVGATSARSVDVRVCAATNRRLAEEVACGRFREDLFYRIAVAVLRLPPLRDRQGDIGLLLDHLWKGIEGEGSVISDTVPGRKAAGPRRLSPEARNVLLRHSWPGNVRELRNTLQRACVWATGSTISEAEMKEAILTPPDTARERILGRPLGDGLSLPDLMSEVARHYLDRAMQEAGGNKTQAARLVGLASYQTLTNWLERYGG